MRVVVMAVAVSAVVVSDPSISSAAGKDPAGNIPGDCFLMVNVPSVTETVANFKKTSSYALYKEPAMRRFIEPAEKNIRKLFEDELKRAFKGTGVNHSLDSMPWPKGRVTFAMRMGKKTIKFPVYDWENSDGEGPPKILKHQERTINSPQGIVLADMGDNADAAKTMLKKLVNHGVEEKGMKRLRRTVRGVRLLILLPEGTKRPDDDAEITEELPIYGFKGNTFIFSTDFKLVRDVLGLMDGADRPALSGNASYRQVMRKLGKGDVAVFLDIQSLIKMSVDESGGQRAERDTALIRTLGADALRGLGAVVQVAPRGNEQFRIKMLLGVKGEPRGLVKMLMPTAASTSPGRLLTKGLAGFLVANYDLGKMYDQLCTMIRKAQDMDIDKVIQTAMQATKPPIGGEPVNLRKEVLEQLTGPITITSRLTKPYTAPDSSSTTIAVGVRNAGVLDSALNRIHNIIISGGDPQQRRKLRGRNVYLLLGGNPFGLMLGMAMGGRPARRAPGAAFAVADDNFVMGTPATVEQSIRDLGRKDIEKIGSDPMYQHASRYIPDQAAMYAYQNSQITTAASWEQLRAAAKAAAKNPRGARVRGRDPNARGPDNIDGVDVDRSEVYPGESMVPDLALQLMLTQLREFVDFSALPDFAAVKKYYGATVAYIKGSDEGVFAEIIQLSAPAR
jgi:hypothetical protein